MGWKETVQPFQVDAKFWYAIWRSADKPNTGPLHDLMIKTRNSYHYAIRRAKRDADLVRTKKLFEASEAGNVNLLEELKNIRKGRKGLGAA